MEEKGQGERIFSSLSLLTYPSEMTVINVLIIDGEIHPSMNPLQAGLNTKNTGVAGPLSL